ncbi:MAG TPA: hypothetical protein VIV60_01630 [Polyangiaceae bacterium]
MASIAMLALASGCGGAVQESGASGELTVVQADEASGKLVAKFHKGGREITFDMRLGGIMEVPPDERAGDATRMKIDAQVLDRNGQPIYMQMAGDEFIDPSWKMPVLKDIDATEREKDFALLQESETAILEAQLPGSFEELRLGALQVARAIGSDAFTAKADPQAANAAQGAKRAQAAIVWDNSATVKYWDYQIYRKDAFFNGSIFDHTAVLLRGWNSNYQVVFTAVSCNHGYCANTNVMTHLCTMPGFLPDDGTASRYFYNEPSGNTTVSSGCSTAVNYLGYNGHVCNDDTILQINAIKYDRSYPRSTGVAGECDDSTANWWAPNCI